MKIEIKPSNEFVFVDGIVARIWRGVTDRGTRCILVVTRIGTPMDSPEEEFRELLRMENESVIMASSLDQIELEETAN